MSLPDCPQCNSEYVHEDGLLLVCPECAYKWNPNDSVEERGLVVLDSDGTRPVGGDSVIIVENLKVKGASKNLKQGTRVKNIRLVEGDHNIDYKIDGFGTMKLKLEFVRKL